MFIVCLLSFRRIAVHKSCCRVKRPNLPFDDTGFVIQVPPAAESGKAVAAQDASPTNGRLGKPGSHHRVKNVLEEAPAQILLTIPIPYCRNAAELVSLNRPAAVSYRSQATRPDYTVGAQESARVYAT
jgi:hypothetical protein